MTSTFDGVRAVFFDVDDTLYDFERSMRLAFEHLHVTFPSLFAQHKVDELEKAYWGFYRNVPEPRKVELINTDPDLFRRTMWGGALRNLAFEGELDAAAKALTDEMQRLRPTHWRAAMYPGAGALLSELKKRMPIGVITNGPSNVQRPKIEALEYRRFFEERRVFVSGEFGARKPDPSIFAAAAKSAGVEPHECVMVGDARQFDMPAKKLGFRTILFFGPREVVDVAKDPYPPDAIARDYGEITRMLLGA